MASQLIQRLGASGLNRSDRWLRVASLLIALLAGFVVAISGSGGDEQLRLVRDMIRAKPASGNIAIVEIDARSLEQVASWPWPRRRHAQIIDQLRVAGAGTIAFDVDFSAASNAQDDASLAAALKRAGGTVILPTFRQKSSTLRSDFAENLPIPAFRDNAFLGSVNVQPDADGQLRSYSYGTLTAGTPRPSIAALLAQSPGRIGTAFRVDTAIDDKTIPRISAIDVLRGEIPKGSLRGKSVIVGATAIEMGDRYVVPGHGIQPGVVVQVLAAETLIGGTTNPDFGPWIPLLLTALVIAFVSIRTKNGHHYRVAIVLTLVLIATPLALELAKTGSVQIIPALTLIGLNAALAAAIQLKRKFAENRLTDAATGLPNARAFERHCKCIEQVAVVVMSVRQFEEMDAILSNEDRSGIVANIMSRLSLGFPAIPVFAYGLGTVALPIVNTDLDALHEQIESAAALFRAPISVGDRTILVTPVFGISTGNGGRATQLLAEARFAVGQAVKDGRRIVVHSAATSSSADRSLTLVADIDRALVGDEIHVVFQPQWDVAAARIAGAEALVRWTHPTLGRVGPDEFIPLLEANGRMHALTLRVFDLCIDQRAAWAVRGQELALSINISANLLDNPSFARDIIDRLETLGPDARHFTLEVTESATIGSTDAAIAALSAFRASGARISIDDYGTGNATLAYLKSFPTDEIKIDKSFVTGMMTNNSDQIVVRSTIELAHELGFKVVAEGTEDADCLARLTQLGCDTVQGWVIGKPMAAEDFERLAGDRTVRAA